MRILFYFVWAFKYWAKKFNREDLELRQVQDSNSIILCLKNFFNFTTKWNQKNYLFNFFFTKASKITFHFISPIAIVRSFQACGFIFALKIDITRIIQQFFCFQNGSELELKKAPRIIWKALNFILRSHNKLNEKIIYRIREPVHNFPFLFAPMSYVEPNQEHGKRSLK